MDNDFDELMRRVDKKNTDKTDRLVNNTVGIILPRGFRKLLETDNEAKRRYLKVLKARMETGNLYLLDTDNCMKNNSPVYGKLGFDTWTTNICCVTGDTLVLTDKGHLPIIDLLEKDVNVWNGEEYSKVVPQMTSPSAEIYEVEFTNGLVLRCTDYHTFYVNEKITRNISKKKTIELKRGDSLVSGNPTDIATYLHRGVEVDSITKTNDVEPVFCFNEPKRGMGVFNGVLTGQSEFIQPTFPEYSSVCVISALNLTKWDVITPEMIKAAFMFLDIVNEEYIRLSEGVPFLEKANRSAKEKRDIGLGVLGLAELFQMRGFAYGDLGSRRLNKEIFSTIRYFGEQYAYEIGLKLGSPKVCQDAGMVRRNASLIMNLPNKSTSFISGMTSGGREPFMSNLFIKKLAKIQHVFKNKHLEKLLESKGKNTVEVWQSIQDSNGSVQHLDFLSKDEKDVFKTFAEISPKDLIDLAADAQEYIDMGQSLNLIKRKNYTLQDIYDIHKYGWDRGIKTFYYMYSSAHAAMEVEGERWDECVSCAD
jgi:hypothetical protein